MKDMSLVEFIQAEGRMCACNPLRPTCTVFSSKEKKKMSCRQFKAKYPQEYIDIVQRWAKEHPLVTNRDKFVEVFGNIPFNFADDANWLNAEYTKPVGEAATEISEPVQNGATCFTAEDGAAYFDNYSEEKSNDLSGQGGIGYTDADGTQHNIDQLTTEPQQKDNKHEIKHGDIYYYINYAEQRAKDIKRANLVANFAKRVNGDWEADWTDIKENKYFISYDERLEEYKVLAPFITHIEGVTYFKTKEDAWRCINEVLEPLDRGEL